MQLQAAQSTSRVSWPKILFGLSPREKILDFKGHHEISGDAARRDEPSFRQAAL